MSLLNVARRERLERAVQHALRERGDRVEIGEWPRWRMRHVPGRRFADIDREIADALDVGVDLQNGDDDAQVGGERLSQREELEAAVVDFDVQLVDRLVAADHIGDELGVACRQACDGLSEPLFGEPAHVEQSTHEGIEFFREVPRILPHGVSILITRTGR